jgi:hypothetical protein
MYRLLGPRGLRASTRAPAAHSTAWSVSMLALAVLIAGLSIGCSRSREAMELDSGEPPPGDSAPSELRVLFVGNSYTYVNDLPHMLAQIAASAGSPPVISVEQVVAPGATLGDHWLDGIAPTRIYERTWTHVVLQEQSQTPPSESFSESARRFGDLIVAAGARPTWFVTWAHAWAFATAPTDPIPDQDALTWAYAEAARPWPQSVLACVGEAFRRSLREHPAIALHQSDASHPTLAGTYLAASTFYVALTGKPVPAASVVPDGLGADDAVLLRETARIGSNCADVQARAIIRLYDDGGDAAAFYDFGRAAGPISRRFYLVNAGHVAADLAVVQSPALPFS